jgi:predicted DNA-binding transcriptional regulator AlpA
MTSDSPRLRISADEPLMDSKEFKRFLGIKSNTTLWAGIKNGYFPKPVQLSTGLRRWIRSEVESFVARAAADRAKG